MVFTFPKVVKTLFKQFSERDYSVLNTRLFVSCWLGFALDQSLTSMRDLFGRLKLGGYEMDISTFSKANQHRSLNPFRQLYRQILELVKRENPSLSENLGYVTCPIDSTIITLTSKLLWALGYHQVKLFTIFNNADRTGEAPLIHFGQEHDYKFANEITESLEENQVGTMDRGFAALEYLKVLQEGNKKFVIRINTNFKLEPLETGKWLVGTGKKRGIYRIVWFCDLGTKKEYRIVTNLPEEIENEEVAEIYRGRWLIELFWKFLKMHLKLDRLICKNPNGIEIQIYSSLIAYLILLLINIPKMWGDSLLDKLRYLQACMCQEFSYVHWLERILHDRPLRLFIRTSELIM